MRAGARRRRQPRTRAIWLVSLGLVPLLIAATIVTSIHQLSDASPLFAYADQTLSAPEPPSAAIGPVTAPELDQSADHMLATIDIEFPPPPPPDPPPLPPHQAQPNSPGTSSPSTPSTSHIDFCAGGVSATAIPGNSASSILAAINTERARIGAGNLSMSSSLSSTAASWSSTMLSNTSGVGSHGLAHNPNRPSGGENVGVTWSGVAVVDWAQSIHWSLMGSEGHCRNIMNPQWSVVGIGTASGNAPDGTYFYFVTQNFQ